MKLYILFFLSVVLFTSAQSIKLIHADKHRSYTDKNGIVVRSLEGNVHVRKDTLSIYCDRAIVKEKFAILELHDNVHFITPSRELNSDNAVYFEKINFAILSGNIVYNDAEQRILTQKANIYFDQKKFFSPVPIEVLRFDDLSRIFSDSGRADLEGHSYVFTGNARYEQPDSSGPVLKINADLFSLVEVEGKKWINASGKVHFTRGELVANCDSASYLYPGGNLKLFNDPRAYWQLNEMIGDTIALNYNEVTRKPDYILLSGQAEVFSPLDSLKNRENYLSGGEIIAKLKGEELSWIEARDNAISRYYIDNSNGKENGLNIASSDTIRLFLKNNVVDSVAIIGGIEGKYVPR